MLLLRSRSYVAQLRFIGQLATSLMAVYTEN